MNDMMLTAQQKEKESKKIFQRYPILSFELEELEEKISKLTFELQKLQKEHQKRREAVEKIQKAIENIPSASMRKLLKLRYLKGMTFCKVAEIADLTERHIYRLRPRALQQFYDYYHEGQKHEE